MDALVLKGDLIFEHASKFWRILEISLNFY